MEEEKIKKEEYKKNNDKPFNYVEDFSMKEPEIYKQNGEIRVCNQGKYDFFIDEDVFRTGICTFELKLPKYMRTEHVKVDLNPQYVRVNVKGKVTQLKFDNEVIVEESTIQRSTTTGYLLIKAPIVGVKPKEVFDKIDRNNGNNVNNGKNIKPKVKNVLKPINDSIDMRKGENIEVVSKMESNFIKVTEKKVEENYDDIDLDEIPDLD